MKLTRVELATLKNTSKGRLAGILLNSATEKELKEADKIFSRTPSFKDLEYLLPILARSYKTAELRSKTL